MFQELKYKEKWRFGVLKNFKGSCRRFHRHSCFITAGTLQGNIHPSHESWFPPHYFLRGNTEQKWQFYKAPQIFLFAPVAWIESEESEVWWLQIQTCARHETLRTSLPPLVHYMTAQAPMSPRLMLFALGLMFPPTQGGTAAFFLFFTKYPRPWSGAGKW